MAFRNPDGSDVLYAYNNVQAPITFDVDWHGNHLACTLPAGATATLNW